MEEWKEYKLGDIAQMKYGKMPKMSANGLFPVWSGYKYAGLSDDMNCPKGTLIVVARGVGGTGDVKIATTDCFLTNLSISVNLDKQICNPLFLYYKFKIKNLKYLDSGSAQSQITIDDLKRLCIQLPPLKKQEELISILKSLDDKIEVNRRINDNLEQQAQALFKSWFVDFEPFKDGEFVESELGMIPKGWRVGKLGDFVKTTSGGTPSRKVDDYYINGNINWVKSKELQNTFIAETEEKITEEAIKNSSAKLLPTHSVLIAMYGATVGEFGITTRPMTCNQAVCALLPNKNVPYSILYTFARNNKNELINKAIGSAQQNISQVIIKNMGFVFNDKAFFDFNYIIDPMLRQIESNILESRRLADLRDTLLPKLMSGEIKVNDMRLSEKQ